MATILVIDDDAHLRDVLQYALEREGFAVRLATNGREGLAMAEDPAIQLLVLDVMMPELDGLEVCRQLRKTRDLPIIFLSSKGDEVDRIVGLELGGDDYLAKPFSPRELVARVRAVLRRRQSVAQPQVPSEDDQELAHGPIVLSPPEHSVSCHGTRVQLTANEFALLHALLRRPKRVATRATLVAEIYNADHHITERTIDTYVRRIRGKFQPLGFDPIETVFGVGYKARGT